MTQPEEVKEELEKMDKTPLIEKLIEDQNFQLTVAEKYDDYVENSLSNHNEPNWNLGKYLMHCIEFYKKSVKH